ncbi:Npun_R2821/Npun_R2822 family protein [Dendronalium sp. ChiSLP03b]|uniref:Npun_R2821/Npun_R2822 family protein n=1 Tax=Dendronalium sp. ChiSLP03b TaxID=3075381 RepID=UPI002AD5061E|nr:Npun_R2821/Npun_R2822 family protein [Dendronalium sp. ChiSLP03b]MDZ8206079.1 sugar transferase [Dendronalium sp. ChiSLP03b]
MTNGIYTLANDYVYNQLVALLNSIEVNAGNVPVCVIAYNDNVEKIRDEIATRKNVTLFDNPDIFARWEEFSYKVWQSHPSAIQAWQEQGIKKFYRVGENRRYCAFDAESQFEKFIYLDADTLVLQPLEFVFQQLDKHDFVVYDFQYKDPGHIYNLSSPKLLEIFSQERIDSEIFCSGFYASKRGIFPPEQREGLLSQLNNGESDVLYMSAPNQSVLNYMRMRANVSFYNFALNLPANEATGCCVTSPHFENQDYILYDKGNRLTYLHYIGLSSKLFNQVCDGENIDFPYRDIFLHYRYLHEPEKRPQFTTKPKAYNASPSLGTRILKKLGLTG